VLGRLIDRPVRTPGGTIPGTVRRLLPLAAVAALLVLPACSSVRPYAATVNGSRISQDELQSELAAIVGNEAYLAQVQDNFQGAAGERAAGVGQRTLSTAFVAALLDRRIGFEIIEQEVRRRGLTVSAADRTTARENVDEQFGAVLKGFPASYTRWLVESFARIAVLERALSASSAVTDQQVAAFYEENAALFRDQACSRHILVATVEAATAVRARIEAGGDFAAIARAESSDNAGPDGGSAAKGGDLGCVARGTFVDEFQAALDSLTAGQVSAPVQTQFGFHVIQLVERKDVPLAEATPQIRQLLEQRAAGQSPVGRFVSDAVSRADIAVNPRYGRFELGDPPGVRPPPAPAGPVSPPSTAPQLLPQPSPTP